MAFKMLMPGLLCVAGETGRSLNINVVPAVTTPRAFSRNTAEIEVRVRNAETFIFSPPPISK